jgi:hypothetical protein
VTKVLTGKVPATSLKTVHRFVYSFRGHPAGFSLKTVHRFVYSFRRRPTDGTGPTGPTVFTSPAAP